MVFALHLHICIDKVIPVGGIRFLLLFRMHTCRYLDILKISTIYMNLTSDLKIRVFVKSQ